MEVRISAAARSIYAYSGHLGGRRTADPGGRRAGGGQADTPENWVPFGVNRARSLPPGVRARPGHPGIAATHVLQYGALEKYCAVLIAPDNWRIV
jgi:hypothetical protein